MHSLIVAYEAVLGRISKVAAPLAPYFGGTAKRERIKTLGGRIHLLSVNAATSRYPTQ
jgi:hypothetical protein